jgi:hypothetical protein
MKEDKRMKTKTKIIYAAFAAATLTCFGLSPAARAQLSPPPDGGYPNQNTAEGDNALFSLTSGQYNTAIGFQALYSNTDGFDNTAIGFQALYSNTDGYFNVATGANALSATTTGANNTAAGVNTMFSNTTGSNNTATGQAALAFNITGFGNTATGYSALVNNTGDLNTATGYDALYRNTSGTLNTAVGKEALFNNTTGSANIALGEGAGSNLDTGNNNIDIYDPGVAGESNTIRIGKQGTQTAAYIAGINGVDKSSGSPVFIDANGQLGTGTASQGPGSVVMLQAIGNGHPPAPAGYTFAGYTLLASKANGGGPSTSYAVYTKN